MQQISDNSVDGSTKRLISLAQKRAAEKDYEQALRYYDEASLKYHRRTIPVELLNSRSAVYIKLQRLSEASLDGKKMIQQSPSDPRGYLRLAQILRYQAVQSKSDTFLEKATKVLQSGIKHADPAKRECLPQRKLMERTLANIKEALKGKTYPDPCTKLPLELFQQILLSFTIKDLLRWRRVSRAWRDAIDGSPSWRVLELNESFKPRTVEQLNRLLRLAIDSERGRNISHFRITASGEEERRCRTGAEEVCYRVLRECSALESVSLDKIQFGRWHGLSQLFNLNTLTVLELHPSFYKRWDIMDDSHKHIYQQYDSRFTMDVLEIFQFIASIPNLRHLHAAGLLVRVPADQLFPWPSTASNLQSLKLYTWGEPIGEPSSAMLRLNSLNLPGLAACAPALVNLELNGCIYQDWELYEPTDFSVFTNLRSLRMNWLFCLDGISMPGETFPRLPESLTELTLCAIGGRHFGLAANESPPRLRNLTDLRISEQFGPALLEILEASDTHLENLTLLKDGAVRSISSSFYQPDHAWPGSFVEGIAKLGKLSSIRSISMNSQSLESTPDSLAVLLAKSCPDLEVCRVAGHVGFTGVGIGELCSKEEEKQLKQLYLEECPRASAEVGMSLRSRGINFSGKVGRNGISFAGKADT